MRAEVIRLALLSIESGGTGGEVEIRSVAVLRVGVVSEGRLRERGARQRQQDEQHRECCPTAALCPTLMCAAALSGAGEGRLFFADRLKGIHRGTS